MEFRGSFHSADNCHLVLGKASHSLNLNFLVKKIGMRIR